MKYETCTPLDVMTMSESDIVQLATELSDTTVPMKVRLAVLKHMYSLLGYSLSQDLLLAMLVDVRQQLILACAGGCKTTSSQVIIILAKILSKKMMGRALTSSEVLCLVYNKENRPQMDKKHSELMTPLVRSDFLTFNADMAHFVNAGITAHTLHSFCKYWIDQYPQLLRMDGFSIVKDGDSSMFFNAAIKSAKKNKKLAEDIKAERVSTLYDLLWGLNLSYDDLEATNPLLVDAINSCNTTVDTLKEIFRSYDAQKKFFKRYDFTDMLLRMNVLLDNNEVRERMHLLYTFIVVDEIQDFTPLMMSILKKLIGPKTRLLAIGDEDQSIYGFRGADVNNAVRFKEHFPESKIFQLMVNRRCGDNILDKAATVIQLNQNRYEKKLMAERCGGKVELVPYNSLGEQMENIISRLTTAGKDEYGSTVVCSREKLYGQPLTFALYRNRIPFHTFNATSFYQHEAFRAFIEIMNLVWKPVKDNWRNVYKITNVKKQDWFSYIGYNEKKQRVEKFADKASLWELKFEPFAHYVGLEMMLQTLYKIHKQINTLFCNEYIDYIIKLFRQNFWETRLSLEPIMFADEVFDWIRGVFGKTAPYPVLYEEFSLGMQAIRTNAQYKSGVTVATMHALKGLEFKNVHLAFMEDSIFPNFSSIDSKAYPPDICLSLKEAENRLAYVAMTRAKDNLHVHYRTTNPSLYVDLMQNDTVSESSQMVFTNKKRW